MSITDPEFVLFILWHLSSIFLFAFPHGPFSATRMFHICLAFFSRLFDRICTLRQCTNYSMPWSPSIPVCLHRFIWQCCFFFILYKLPNLNFSVPYFHLNLDFSLSVPVDLFKNFHIFRPVVSTMR